MDTGKTLKALKGSDDIGQTISTAIKVLEDYEDIKSKRDAAEKAHQSLAARYMGLKASVDKQEALLADIRAEIASLKAEHEELSRGMPRLQAKAAEVRAVANEEMDRAKKEAAEARGEALTARHDLQAVRDRIEEEKVRLQRLIGAANG